MLFSFYRYTYAHALQSNLGYKLPLRCAMPIACVRGSWHWQNILLYVVLMIHIFQEASEYTSVHCHACQET